MAAKREGLKAASSQVPNAPVLPGPGQWLALNHLIAINDVPGKPNRVAMTNRLDRAPNLESNAVIYAFLEHFLK